VIVHVMCRLEVERLLYLRMRTSKEAHEGVRYEDGEANATQG
jgi:hypothetical protein